MIELVEGVERRKTPNEVALTILLSTLSARGYDVMTAHDGRTALGVAVEGTPVAVRKVRREVWGPMRVNESQYPRPGT